MKIGASNYALSTMVGEERAIEILANAGFDSIDYSLGTTDSLTGKELFGKYSDEEFDAYFKNIRAILDKNKIAVEQTHAHTGHFSYTTTEDYFNIVLRDIRASSILGATHIVIHPLIMPSYKYDENKAECKEYNMAFFRRLTPYLEQYGIKEGLEPMWNYDSEKKKICPTVLSRPEEILDYKETLASDRFVACLDLGHINLTGGDTDDTPDGAIRKLADCLEILHVHDTDGIDDLHVPPFMGNIDWRKVMQALKDIDYKGTLNFEVGEIYFEKYGKDMAQASADYLAQTGRFLRSLFETL